MHFSENISKKITYRIFAMKDMEVIQHRNSFFESLYSFFSSHNEFDKMIHCINDFMKIRSIFPNEDLRDDILRIIYESCADYIQEGNWSEIETIEDLYRISCHVSPYSLGRLILYLYPYLKQDLKEMLYIHFLFQIYMIFTHHYSLKRWKKKNEWKKCEELMNQYYDVVRMFINHNIIRNPLFTTLQMRDEIEYAVISIYDIFVHSGYILEDYFTSLLFFKLILHLLPKKKNEVFIEFHQMDLNIKALQRLSDKISNENREYIHEMCEKNEESYFYMNTFQYYMHKIYIFMYRNKEYQKVSDKWLSEIRYYYEEIFFKRECMIFDLLDQDLCEITNLLFDIQWIQLPQLDSYWIDQFEKSEEWSVYGIMHTILVWSRNIYVRLDKNNRKDVRYDTKKNRYYLRFDENTEIRIDYMEYVKDFVLYIKMQDEKVHNYLIQKIKLFIEVEYEELRKKEEEIEDKTCAICLDDVDNGEDRLVCHFCKKMFHEKCLNESYKSRHDHCSICRKYMLNNYFTFSKIRIKFFQDVIREYDS